LIWKINGHGWMAVLRLRIGQAGTPACHYCSKMAGRPVRQLDPGLPGGSFVVRL
jgi:hypothetical protein